MLAAVLIRFEQHSEGILGCQQIGKINIYLLPDTPPEMSAVADDNAEEKSEQWTENNLGNGSLMITFKTEKESEDEADDEDAYEEEPLDPTDYLETNHTTEESSKNDQEYLPYDDSALEVKIKEEPLEYPESVLPDIPTGEEVTQTKIKEEPDSDVECNGEFISCDATESEQNYELPPIIPDSIIHRCDNCRGEFDSEQDLETHLQECSKEVAMKNAIKARLKLKLGLNVAAPLGLLHLMPEKEVEEEKNPAVHGNCKPLPGKKYGCNLCGATFMNRSNVRVHKVLKHSSDRKFECNICNAKFKIKFILQKHINTKHSEIRNFCCTQCEAKFKTKHELISHTRFKHTDERNWECRICGSKFKTKAHLQAHESNRHTKVRNFKCDMCSATFKSKAALNRHLKYNSSKLHSNVTVFECTLCNMRFKAELPMKLHMAMSHSTEQEQESS
nr:PREDICTED: zinc finger protein 585A-like isoform X1 [Bemisia tabaci]